MLRLLTVRFYPVATATFANKIIDVKPKLGFNSKIRALHFADES